ncbi:MAG: hypothetical protein AAF310_05990 [Myxococcota bacterium]
MADVLNCERLQGVLAPHELSDPGKLGQAGFVVKKETLLCASSHRAQSFWAPGASSVPFRAALDGRNTVSGREWTPITHKEYERLAPLKEPLTGESHVLFAWMPLPQKQGHTLPSQAAAEVAQTVSADEVAQQLKQLPEQAASSGRQAEDLLGMQQMTQLASAQNNSNTESHDKQKDKQEKQEATEHTPLPTSKPSPSKSKKSPSSFSTKKSTKKQEVSDTKE